MGASYTLYLTYPMKIQNSVLYSPSFPTLYDVDEAQAAAAIAAGPRTYWTGVDECAQQSFKRRGRARRRLSRSVPWINTTNSFFELFLRTTAKPADWVAGMGPTKEQTLEFANFMCNTRRRRSLKDPTRKGCGSTS